MDSMFRTRGSGISSDMESTIVPQLLAEIDGVETLKNVIVIGASNREDLIDPAILRPGRLDVKIKIERPDETAATQIFSRYLTDDLPLDPDQVADLGGGDPDKCARPSSSPLSKRCTATTRRTSSSRSPTRTATRRSCTSRTSRPAP
jgi:proteasome-associated ATPase